MSFAIPFSAPSATAEDQRGFFFGAGWPGGGQVHLLSNRQQSSRLPSTALMMQSYQDGAALDRLQERLDHQHSNASTTTPVQLRAGYDFGRILGYMSLEETDGVTRLQTDGSNISLGIAVPLSPNLQFSGELRQSETAAGSDTQNVWSVTAGFRF
ncbi:hypothetical protein KMP13_00685 [Epibacterium ulvae]|uniref:hypothetical protein n=1 Tax=Epibacterium ulvae TaxID=1156985 RepID=UPI001BFCD13F|nr:hypothetical protein [Epibacterium ulvae]MBT8152435.1 hypothetical protein [Epibacterium ulvae]